MIGQGLQKDKKCGRNGKSSYTYDGNQTSINEDLHHQTYTGEGEACAASTGPVRRSKPDPGEVNRQRFQERTS